MTSLYCLAVFPIYNQKLFIEKNTQSKQTNTTKQRAKKIDYGQKQYRIYLCTSEKYALYSNVSLSLNIKHHTLKLTGKSKILTKLVIL